MIKKFHIYTRVSTLEQKESGTSLDTQKELGEKLSKQVSKGKLRSRFLMGTPLDKTARNKAIIISRNINKAKKIMTNVCKGIFPGNYSDN